MAEKLHMNKIFIALALFFVSNPVLANLTNTLGDLIGYTIVASKTIVGWRDENNQTGDSFEGCDYGRIILFEDDKILTCAQYGYEYAYRPEAIILFNGSNFKMIVGNSIYDMLR